MFIYLHGFNSAPASFKARLLHERLRSMGRGADFWAPALPPWPPAAIEIAEAGILRQDPARVTLVGSSLGGHYATWLAQRHGVRAVLVNPAMRPADLLVPLLGPQTNLYTRERYELTPAHLACLRDLEVARVDAPERFLVVVATGDEVLDYRDALARFARSPRIVHPGSDHGFAAFERYLDAVIAFGW